MKRLHQAIQIQIQHILQIQKQFRQILQSQEKGALAYWCSIQKPSGKFPLEAKGPVQDLGLEVLGSRRRDAPEFPDRARLGAGHPLGIVGDHIIGILILRFEPSIFPENPAPLDSPFPGIIHIDLGHGFERMRTGNTGGKGIGPLLSKDSKTDEVLEA